MKLVRFGEPGRERPGVWMNDGRILDVRASAFHVKDYDAHFFERFGLAQLQSLLADPGAKFVEAKNVRLGPPIAPPAKILCVGANYAAHAKEFGAEPPERPILFAKATSAIVGPFDPILLPADPEAVVDAEAELAVVIGRTTRAVPRERALDAIAGYTVLNDVTDRTAQRTDGQWFRAKSADAFSPLGPFLVTPDEAPDFGAMRVWQRLDGETLQEASVPETTFDVPTLIAYASERMTLHPGDVISTGTPPGIGSAHEPPRLLRPGCIVEVGVDGIGAQRSEVCAAKG